MIGPVERLVKATVSGAGPTCGLAAKTAFKGWVVPVRVGVGLGVRVDVRVLVAVVVPGVWVADAERVGDGVRDPVGDGVLVSVSSVEVGEGDCVPVAVGVSDWVTVLLTVPDGVIVSVSACMVGSTGVVVRLPACVGSRVFACATVVPSGESCVCDISTSALCVDVASFKGVAVGSETTRIPATAVPSCCAISVTSSGLIALKES